MGIFVNPGNHAYKEAVNSRVYVDKSQLVSYMNQILNTNEKHVCVSRPRRFGKSMAADMLAAYYRKGSDYRKLFGGLKAEKGEF
ncbi:MAG: AAA family ATPase, partial [Lachnospiraceae bacterium]